MSRNKYVHFDVLKTINYNVYDYSSASFTFEYFIFKSITSETEVHASKAEFLAINFPYKSHNDTFFDGMIYHLKHMPMSDNVVSLLSRVLFSDILSLYKILLNISKVL